MTPLGCSPRPPSGGAQAEGAGGDRRGLDGPPREVLPCPLPFGDLHVPSSGGICGSTLRRLRGSFQWKSWANDCMTSLNEMYGGSPSECLSECALSAGQKQCVELVSVACRSLGKPTVDEPASRAFQELCGSKAGYSCCEAPVSRSSFVEGLTSLPSLGSVPADPSSLLQGSDLLCWREWQTRILLPPDEVRVTAVYLEMVYPDLEFYDHVFNNKKCVSK